MTGETYLTDYIRLTSREQALKALQKAKEQEQRKNELVKQRKLKRRITYDKEQRLTTIHYYV